jgi:hypothetical protein
MDTPSGIKDSIPAWIKFSVQAPGEIPYNGIYYDPPEEVRFYISSMQDKHRKRDYQSKYLSALHLSWDTIVFMTFL